MRKSISLKIFSIALVVIALMGVVSGVSYHYLDKVSDEALELAHYYIPITLKVQQAARHASAELLHFERHLALKRAGASEAQQKAELDEMKRRAGRVEAMVRDALELVNKGHADGELDIRSKNFDRVQGELPQILDAHSKMQETIAAYLAAPAGGQASGATVATLEERLSQQRSAISREIADVTDLLDKITRDSAEEALGLEARAARINLAVTLAAVAIGLALAALITRSLVRPVRDLVASTQAVRQGNLQIQVNVSSSDEIATLADSFNHMVGGLRQKESIQNTFGKYVDPRIVKSLIEDESLAQAGEKRRMTIFFSDIEGFTALAERLPPEVLVNFLNRYFALMAEVVREEHGIIDKYIGDAVMAFWGPPFVDEAEHAVHACRAAVRQLARLTDLHAALPSILGDLPGGIPHVNIRIGLTTGLVTVGSIGSDTQRNYTVVGDSVNLASRLEAANKQYGTRILVDGETIESARGVVETREIDRIRVVGRSEPVRIFEVLGLKGAVDPDLLDFRSGFERALGLLRANDVAGARAAFETCAARRPGDGPTKLFLARLRDIGDSGMPADWDGVWNLDAK